MSTLDKLDILRQNFLKYAYVKDAEQGYIVAKQFNLNIDTDILELASGCWADHYRNQAPQIDAVVGLPDAGARLVSVLAEKLRVTSILPSKRTTLVPGAWEDVVGYSNQSFTSGQDDVKSYIGFVRPGMKVLVVDDVVAHGHTAVAAIKALQSVGVEVVGLATLFDKVWQQGSERILESTGVQTFSLIRIKEITKSGTIQL